MLMPSSLIPSRFLTLVAHFVIVVNIFWSREDNVLACLPSSYTFQQYQRRDTELIIALSVTLGMFLIELLGFFSGVSMFNSTQSLISIGAHGSASAALLFFLFEQWPCNTYWWIFSFCSVFPACVEIVLMIAVFGLKKKPF
ncbi:transmembrane protein 107-like isoform X2 [Hypanus sabinus]|uniref:transmembrane protein 107-like isoform X2 n=1 Tax=Hypanus sabinus TaxID=79690 RepID=UPI0028C44286|nr:transmembrane protein 107-like isoform X2 [Hypanus sabinus]